MGPFDSAWFAAAIIAATPLIFAAVGELFSERAGVLNVGIEGMVLMGAFWGFWGDWYFSDTWAGIACGLAAGMVLASVMAVLSIQARADQIVVGVGLNILALGITTFAFREIFGSRAEIVLDRMDPIKIPLLSDIPGVGEALFDNTPITYLAFTAVLVASVVLYRTKWGLSIRAVGEVPAAADTAGVSVAAKRWQAILVTGALAGVAGASLSVVRLGLFQENMSAGRGFLALAAVIFGRWRPLGVLGACLVFGAADALQLRLQAEEFIPREVWLVVGIGVLVSTVWVAWQRWHGKTGLWRPSTLGPVFGLLVAACAFALWVAEPNISLPSQLWLALPYVVTLAALASIKGSSSAPAAITQPYRREIEA
ncbi:MAG: ABC transporter permease [Acidimicrobiia bacterium]